MSNRKAELLLAIFVQGITKHPHGKWEARIGAPNASHVYLGLYDSEEVGSSAI